MNVPESSAYKLAMELDSFLGDPTIPGGPFSYREIVEAEDASTMPSGTRENLEEWGFHEYLVPQNLGGRLRSIDELFMICRTLARRNMAASVMYGSTFLAALPVWLWGTREQQDFMSRGIFDGHLACFALSEREHGSDLRANETRIEEIGNDFVLTGTKWPVGNATRGRFLTVCARTSSHSFSLVLIDRDSLPEDKWQSSAAVRLVGLSGHDVSGISFYETPVPKTAQIGAAGTGLTQVMKAMQVTRTAIAGLSVGTMDAALKIATNYAQDRRLYGAPITDIPAIREQIAVGYIDLFIGECVAIPISRAVGVAPERMSLWSAIAKYFVPVLADECLESMATVLGARSYLREGPADGAFQKIKRDHAIASIFEGTTHVNLHWIATQLPAIAGRHTQDLDPESTLHSMFYQCEDSADWRPDGSRLRISNSGQDEVTQDWPSASRRISSTPTSPEVHDRLVELCRVVDHHWSAFYSRIQSDQNWTAASGQADAVTHCYLHAISSCVQMWVRNRDSVGGRFATGEWLVLCLERLLNKMGVPTALDSRCLGGLAKLAAELPEDASLSVFSLG